MTFSCSRAPINDHVTILERIGDLVARETDFGQVLRQVLHALHDQLGYELVSVYMIEHRRLILQYATGYAHVIHDVPAAAGVMWSVVQSGQAELVEDPAQRQGFVFATPDISSEVCAPIHEGNEVVGVLNVETRHKAVLNNQDLSFLSQVAQRLSTGLQHARLQRAAQETELRYRSLLNHLKEVIFELDAQGRITLLSPVWQTVTGFEVEKSLGRTLLEFFSPDDAKTLGEQLFGVLGGHQRSFRQMVSYRNSGGQTAWFELHASALHDEFGSVQGLTGSLLDVTEEQQAKGSLVHAEQGFRRLLESLNGVVWEATATIPGITYMSPQAKEWFGHESERFYEDPYFWDKCVHPDDFERAVNDYKNAVLEQRNYQSEYRFRTAAGEYIWIRDVVSLSTETELWRLRGVMMDITKHKEAEERLRLLESAVLHTNDAILITKRNDDLANPWQITYANPAFERLSGHSSGDLIGQAPSVFKGPDDDSERAREIGQRLESGQSIFEQTLEYRKDGTPIWVERSIAPMLDQNWLVSHAVSSRRDISAQKHAQELEKIRNAIFESIARFEPLEGILERVALLLEQQLPGAMACITRLEGSAKLSVLAAPNLPLGFIRGVDGLASGLVAASCGTAAFHGTPVIAPDISVDPLWADQLELALDYHVRAAWSVPIFDSQWEVLGTVALYFKAIRQPCAGEQELLETAARLAAIAIEQKTMAERLHHQAEHDTLTQLPNRSKFQTGLQAALDHARRHDTAVGVLYLDLDGFKRVNDTLGHAAGDQLLRAVAERLKARVRKTDSLARMGGDEFALCIGDVKQPEGATKVARKIINALQDPFVVADREFRISGSIGIAVFPQDGLDVVTLERHADTALHRAKASGKSTWKCFQPEMNATMLEHLELEVQLRRALERQEFLLHYQPQVNALGELVGLEALLRWQQGKRTVSPAQFLPVAEETGLIGEIDAWVLREACMQVVDWMDRGFEAVSVSVNITPLQFKRSDFVNEVAMVLEETSLAPEYLKVELTESVFMQDLDLAVERMKQLRALGVKLSLDDFGTGYSSLSYLKHLPVDQLKIDRAFVRELDQSAPIESPDGSTHGMSKDHMLVAAIVSLAKRFGLEVVAEGVETASQATTLCELGCDRMQGYWFSKPQTPEQLEHSFLRRQNSDGSTSQTLLKPE